MKTREMLTILTNAAYPLKLVAAQSGVSYMKVFRYFKNDGGLSPDEKAKIWKFAIMQPVISDALDSDIQEEK